MSKSNGISSDVTVVGGGVVYLSGERLEYSENGVVFRHKRPRSSKMLRSIIPLKDVIVCGPDSISFFGDPSRYGVVSYSGTLNGVHQVADNIFSGEDGDGNTILVNGGCTQFTSEDDGETSSKKKVKKVKKSS